MASEFLLNGNFEASFYGAGIPEYWTYNIGDGPGDIQGTSEVSPFTNVYPIGSNSVRFADGISNPTRPNLLQSISIAPTEVVVSFDFFLAAIANAPWKLSIVGSAGLNLDFLIGSGNSLQYVGGTAGTISVLNSETWYHVSTVINDTDETFYGSLTRFGGASIPFAGSLYPNGPSSTETIMISDASSALNPKLYLDNVSIRDVPEPQTGAILVCGLVLLFSRRTLRGRLA